MMRWWVSLLAVLWALPALADDPVNQTDLFALYCIGVMDASAARRAAGPPHQCIGSESKQECDDRAEAIRRNGADIAYRRGRFERYLKARVTLSSDRGALINTASGPLQRSGSTDLAACLDYTADRFPRNFARCEKACGVTTWSIECRNCQDAETPAVCKSVQLCDDPSRLPF